MKANGKPGVCYNIQTAVDGKNKLIAEFEVTNKVPDVNQLTPMAVKAKEIPEVETITAVAGAGYDSVQDVVKSMEQGIRPHVAGEDFDIRVPADENGTGEITAHYKGRCVYFAGRNIVLCPTGRTLYPRYYKKGSGRGVFYHSEACKACTCKCSTEARGRHHYVSMPESAFTTTCDDKNPRVKQIRITADKGIVSMRKSIVEHPFGTVKRAMDAGYCLTKGLKNVSGEFSLTFLAYNLKRAIKITGGKQLIACVGM